MADLGWQGWVFPRNLGGGGGSFLELAILEQELGRVVAPTPFFTSVIRVGLTILALGPERQRERFIPGIASGNTIMTMAVYEASGRVDGDVVACRATTRGGRLWLDGAKSFTAFADVADGVLCIVRTAGDDRDTEGLSAIVIDPSARGLTLRATPALSQGSVFGLELSGVAVDDVNVVGPLGEARAGLERAKDQATICLAAEMLGGSEALLEMTLEHASNRLQRGRPLGRHQALQHHCADVAVEIDVGRGLVYEAAWRIDHGMPATVEASMAKAWMSHTYRRSSWVAALVHGGTGFMQDHPLTFHYRRAKAAELILGDPDHHRGLVARAMLDGATETPREHDTIAAVKHRVDDQPPVSRTAVPSE